MLFIANIANAATTSANINQGNVQVGGSISFSNTWPTRGDSVAVFNTDIPVEYFFVDNFSLGGSFGLTHVSAGNLDYTVFSVGPSATYYFLVQDRLTPYAGASLLYTHNDTDDGDNYLQPSAKFGVNYFITPSVAIGPSVRYTHTFRDDNRVDFNGVSIFANFSIYL